MNTRKRIRLLFARSAVSVPPDVDERMIDKALSAFDGEMPRAAGARRTSSRIARIAAGILVLATIVGFLSYLGLPLDGSGTALARVRAALNETAWIHVAVTARSLDDRQSHDYEMWFSPQRKIRIIKSSDPNAPILWSDYLTRERQCYEPGTGKLTLSYEYKPMPESQEPPWNYLNYVLGPDAFPNARVAEHLEGSGKQQTRVYTVTLEESEVVADLRLVTDMASRLPTIMMIEVTDTENGQQASMEARFDYPFAGPEDIYAVGVPRSAQVIDDRPTPEVEELARICRQYRSLFQRYIFIAIGTHGQGVIDYLEVSCVDGDTALAGREWKAITYNYTAWPRRGEPLDIDGLDNVDSILTWIGNDARVRLWMAALWDGRYEHSVQIREGQGPVYRKSRNMGGRRDLHGFAWPCYVPSGRISEDEFSKQNGYICWETQGRRFHFDPAHDYCCVRLEQDGGTWIRETLDFARTETGLWYPRTVRLTIVRRDAAGQELSREVTHTDTLYLKQVRGFPRGFFDQGLLPRTSEALRTFPKVPHIDPR